ncbi:MAG: flagellar biosynthetic protein FliO [Polyangiaceae bacterium]
MSPYAGYLVETLVTLVAVSVLAWVLLFGAKKFGLGRASGAIRLVGKLPLDARRSIVLVKVGAQVLVVGVGDGGFTKLGELAASELPAEPEGEGSTFADAIARALARNPKKDAAGSTSEPAE